MSIVLFLFINSIVIISSFHITYKLFGINNFVDSLICWFIFYLGQVIFSELFLGIFGILYLRNIILLNLLILAITWLIAKEHGSSFSLSEIKNSINELLKNKIILFGFCIILGFGLVKIFINLVNPPFGWDDLNYHFTFPVEWLKHSNLNIPITISDDPSPSYYPINGSLFFLWLMLPLKNVFLADLGQVPFFVLAFLAIYNISRRIGLNKELSFYAAALFLIIPNVFKQLEIAYVDMMVAALFLICINYLFILNKELSLRNVLLYSMSMGLFIGTKTVALPYSILLIIPFIYSFIKYNKKFYLIIILIFFIVVLGGFTYVKNFLETRNPLYPLNFKILGKAVFKGAMDINTYRIHFKVDDYRLSKILFHEGLGAQSLIFILPSVFLALPFSIIKKRKSLNFNVLYFLILPILIYFIYRYVIPLANTRYLYPLLGVGIIAGFYTAQILNVPKQVLRILAVICVLASMAELSNHQELIVSIILTFLLFFLLPILMKNIQQDKLIKKPLFIISISIFIICTLIFIQKDYVKNEYQRYIKMEGYSGFWPDATRAWEWLNRNTAGNNIAYVGRPVPFPLYGTNFKNNVYYVSVNKTDPAKLHYFPHSQYRWGDDFLSLHKSLEEKGNYRQDADYSVWLNNLLKRNTDYLFIYSLHQTKDILFPMEDDWAQGHPEIFEPVFKNDTIHIYKIAK